MNNLYKDHSSEIFKTPHGYILISQEELDYIETIYKKRLFDTNIKFNLYGLLDIFNIEISFNEVFPISITSLVYSHTCDKTYPIETKYTSNIEEALRFIENTLLIKMGVLYKVETKSLDEDNEPFTVTELHKTNVDYFLSLSKREQLEWYLAFNSDTFLGIWTPWVIENIGFNKETLKLLKSKEGLLELVASRYGIKQRLEGNKVVLYYDNSYEEVALISVPIDYLEMLYD